MRKIVLNNGEYEIIEDLEHGRFEALRNGEKWRNLVGDNLILALVQEIDDYKKIEHNRKLFHW